MRVYEKISATLLMVESDLNCKLAFWNYQTEPVGIVFQKAFNTV